MNGQVEKECDDLALAWQYFHTQLNEARHTLLEHTFAPPMDTRTAAEGYRYLLGQLHRLIETELQQDVRYPYIQHHPSLASKYTIDNADCAYLYAPIDPTLTYKLTGHTKSTLRWKNRDTTSTETSFAPSYVIFETHRNSPGDSGTVQELQDGSRVLLDMIDSTTLQIDDNGDFEILISAKKPKDYMGNYLCSERASGEMLPRGEKAPSDIQAFKLYIRELFGDWENEVPMDMYISCLDQAGLYPTPRNSATTSHQIRALGDLIKNQMNYWMQMYGILLDPFQQASDKKPSHLPINAIASPKPASAAGGGGQASNFYAAGIFQLAPSQGLLIEIDLITEPQHMSFHLSNFWGESLDFANHVSSLNRYQAIESADGKLRIIVSSMDPMIQNWLDTTGLTSGYLTLRFTYSVAPPLENYPKVSCQLGDVDTLKGLTNGQCQEFSAEQRIEQIAIRQRHVAQRYRQH